MERNSTKFEIVLSKIAVNDNDFTLKTFEKKFDNWKAARTFIRGVRKKKYWSYIDIKPLAC